MDPTPLDIILAFAAGASISWTICSHASSREIESAADRARELVRRVQERYRL